MTPTYDDNGNLTKDAWYRYKYDAWNRLVEVEHKDDPQDADNVVIAAYTYDATGRRIKKDVQNAGTRTGVEYFYYAGQQMIEVRNGSETLTQQFVFGTQYVDEPIRMDIDTDNDGDVLDSPGSAAYYHHHDANYNVVLLTDSTGNEAEFYQYSPYGQLTTFDADYRPVAQPAVHNPFTYTGRFHDVETGLYYYRARHHHPSLGRFVQRDSFAFRGGDAGDRFNARRHYHDGMNLLQYVNSNAVNRIDPSGQFGFSALWCCLGDVWDCWSAWTCVGSANTYCSSGERIEECVDECCTPSCTPPQPFLNCEDYCNDQWLKSCDGGPPAKQKCVIEQTKECVDGDDDDDWGTECAEAALCLFKKLGGKGSKLACTTLEDLLDDDDDDDPVQPRRPRGR